jgi:cell division protein FtsL
VRLAAAAAALPDSRAVDRLVRGRAWIAVLAVGLMGIVFMQVSLLKLNTGIGRAVTTAETLERQNSQLRLQIATLDNGQRIAGVAAQLGLVMPGADRVAYVTARPGDARRAARSITAPAPVVQQPAAASATMTQPQAAATQTPVAQPQAQAPVAQAQAQAPVAPAVQPTSQAPAPAVTAQPQVAATTAAATTGGVAPTP